MDDILNEAYGIIQCKDCPWYKMCVTPMKFTAEDLRRQMEQSPGGMRIGPEQASGIDDLLGNMATAAQNSLLEGCPVFIQRLRNSPRLAQKLKEIMLNWGNDENENR